MTLLVGVDPGVEGAIAFVRTDSASEPRVIDMPTFHVGGRAKYDARSIALAMLDRLDPSVQELVLIEDAQVFSPGKIAISGMARCVGIFEGICGALKLRYELVSPSVWKRALGLAGKPKEASIRLASQRFPKIEFNRKKDHGRAEALLLTWWWNYARRDAGKTYSETQV